MTRSRLFDVLALGIAVGWVPSCIPAEGVSGAGGATGTGGATASTGGATASTGGATASTGGATASTGGTTGSSGGATASTGGTTATTGGATGTGGRGTGGTASGGRGGTTGTGGAVTGGRGGTTGTGGAASGGRGGTTGTGGAASGGSGAGGALAKFSFFATSVAAMRRLSNNMNGFGGDLRYGQATGIEGADKICHDIAETSMPGSGAKTWRAFLSATKGGANDGPIHSIDRVGEGPWYDRLGRLVSMNKTNLVMIRPSGADPGIINDLPNEDGVPNHNPDGTGQVDNHDFLTGSAANGTLFNTDWKFTCHDWASKVGTDGTPRCGHTWPRGSQSWISILNESGCEPGIFLMEAGPPGANGTKSVGDGGGYGGIYCLALSP